MANTSRHPYCTIILVAIIIHNPNKGSERRPDPSDGTSYRPVFGHYRPGFYWDPIDIATRTLLPLAC